MNEINASLIWFASWTEKLKAVFCRGLRSLIEWLEAKLYDPQDLAWRNSGSRRHAGAGLLG